MTNEKTAASDKKVTDDKKEKNKRPKRFTFSTDCTKDEKAAIVRAAKIKRMPTGHFVRMVSVEAAVAINEEADKQRQKIARQNKEAGGDNDQS